MTEYGQVSQKLAELLAAYGEPPRMPEYQGDATEYSRAVKVFQILSATPEAVARRAAMKRYFGPVDESPNVVMPDQQHPTV